MVGFDLAEARRLYEDGLSCQRIAVQMGYSRGYVSARLRRSDVRMRPTGRPAVAAPVNVVELVRLRDQGSSWATLARHFDVSTYAVQHCYLRAAASTETQDGVHPQGYVMGVDVDL